MVKLKKPLSVQSVTKIFGTDLPQETMETAPALAQPYLEQWWIEYIKLMEHISVMTTRNADINSTIFYYDIFPRDTRLKCAWSLLLWLTLFGVYEKESYDFQFDFVKFNYAIRENAEMWFLWNVYIIPKPDTAVFNYFLKLDLEYAKKYLFHAVMYIHLNPNLDHSDYAEIVYAQ